MLGIQVSPTVIVRTIPQILGGATASIFPEIEALLLQGEYQDALLYFARRKNMDKYRSVMDFFFCELHPEWQRACQRFYDGQGQQLKELLLPSEFAMFNKRMLIALEVAREEYHFNSHMSWARYCDKVEGAFASTT